MKRILIKDIQKYAEGNNLTLLSDTYINAKSNLQFQCSKGHNFERTWDTIRRRPKCPICTGHSYDKKFHIESLKKLAEQRNHILLSKNYSNTHAKYSFKCNIHNHVFSTTATHYKSGRLGCPYCANKLTQNLIKKEIINRSLKYNYSIINYTEGSKNSSLIKCSCGNTLNILNDNLRRYFTRCKNCSLKGQGLYSEKYFKRNPKRKYLRGTLYLVYLKKYKQYKVGITSTKLNTRLRKLPDNNLVKSYQSNLYIMYKLEEAILKEFAIENDFVFQGHTECINKDISKVILFADNKFRELSETLSETTLSQADE